MLIIFINVDNINNVIIFYMITAMLCDPCGSTGLLLVSTDKKK